MIAWFAKVIGRMCIHAGTGRGGRRTSFRNARPSHLPPKSESGSTGARRALSWFVPLSGRGHSHESVSDKRGLADLQWGGLEGRCVSLPNPTAARRLLTYLRGEATEWSSKSSTFMIRCGVFRHKGCYGTRLANAYVMVAMVTLTALLSTGCVLSSRSSNVPQGSQAQGYGQQSRQQSQKGLIKPYIPGSPDAPDASQQSGVGEATDLRPPSASQGEGTNRGVPARAGSPPPASQGTPQGRNQWESQKVKAAAIKIAKTVPAVIKIKVCYAVENDEWWVTLYDDHGELIDLKQYTWNREKLALEPFLVLRQISKSQLEHDLTQKTSGRACEILDYPSSR